MFWVLLFIQVICRESQEAKKRYYCRRELGELADLVHAEFAPDQEASSPLWFSKEISKEKKDNYHLDILVPSHLEEKCICPKCSQSICFWRIVSLILRVFLSVTSGAGP